MRLIDADKFIEFWFRASDVAEKIPGELGKMLRELYAEVIEKIKEQPTIEAAPVEQFVQCMNCTRWKKDAPGCTDFVGRCEIANYMVGATGYCVYAKRKDK